MRHRFAATGLVISCVVVACLSSALQAGVVAPGRSGGASFSPAVVRDWTIAVGGLFNSSAPDLTTLNPLLSSLKGVDLSDLQTRTALAPVYATVQAQMQRLPTSAAAARAAPADPTLAAKYVALDLLGDFQLPGTRPQVAALSRAYHDALPSMEKEKIRAQLLMLHMESMAAALGQTQADGARAETVTASIGDAGPIGRMPSRPASWNLQAAHKVALNSPTSPERIPATSPRIKRKGRPNVLQTARERLKLAYYQLDDYFDRALGYSDRALDYLEGMIQSAWNSSHRLPHVISIKYYSIPDKIWDAATALGWNNKSWLDKPGMTVAVAGWEIPGGVRLDSGSEETTAVFLTDYFFKSFGLPVPEGAKPATLWAYRYYSTREKSSSGSRGSGRDHLIALNSLDLRQRAKAIKGSGVNPNFSAVNGAFDLSDFRRNGLQAAGDDPGGEHGGGVEEYIVGRNLADAGVPTLPQDRLTLLPQSLQTETMNKGKPHMLAVQVERELEDARESFYGRWPSRAQRLKLAAAMLFNNIGHGAINPENLTGNGKIADVGHVTFSYPLTSGLYRCTVCQGVHGNIQQGILPYYFDAQNRTGKYRQNLSPDDASDLVNAMLKNIGVKTASSHLTAAETQAFVDAIGDRLYFDLHSSRIIAAQMRLLNVDPKAFDRGKFFPGSASVSLRALMQVAALKRTLGEEPGRAAREHLLFFLIGDPQRDHGPRIQAEVLLDLFDRLFAEMNASPEELQKSLFREYLPTSEIEHAIYARLKRAAAPPKKGGESGSPDITSSYEREARVLRAIVRRYRKPVDIPPQKFLDVLLSLGNSPR